MPKHSHYFKPVAGLQHIDVYRVLQLFGVTDPCLQHAIKKLLVAGGRGAKDISQDVQEAIDTLLRWQAMRKEDDMAQSVQDMWAQLGGMRGNGEQAAVRTLQGMGYTFHGGQLWKPPLGQPPAFITEEPAADFDEQRADIIGQNGNDGEHYTVMGFCRDCGVGPLHPHKQGCKHAVHALTATPPKEPERPRHLCQTCAQGHATHECTAGIGGER